jgi:hypothetical protein
VGRVTSGVDSDEGGVRPRPRDNGLHAARYVALADLDPRVADDLLGRLKAEGIAAYAAPTPGQVGGYLDVRMPTRPTARLWVDARSASAAARLVTSQDPSASPLPLAEPVPGPPTPASAPGEAAAPAINANPGAGPDTNANNTADNTADTGAGTGTGARTDEEAIWAAIVADLTTPAPAPAGERPWPRDEDTEPAPLRSWSPPEEVAEDDDHYEPPAPPPLPRLQPATVVACLLLVCGLGLLLLPALLGEEEVRSGWALLGVAGVVGGLAMLVWRMRDAPRDDSDPDDGAVV